MTKGRRLFRCAGTLGGRSTPTKSPPSVTWTKCGPIGPAGADAENTCYIASVNYASEGSPTTSAVVDPEGTVVCWQPYGEEGILTADLDLSRATRVLAMRLRTEK